MRAVDVLKKKRDGGELSPAEIDAFVAGAARGSWEKYQLSAMLMAICTRGMTPAETAHLTRSMTDHGTRIDLSDIPGVKVDKHSTGGVGDKTSLILAPLAAACGVVVPMMSGRGLGHTGGTLDKLESIRGFNVNLSVDEFKAILRDVGCAMIGQTADVAPADKTLYALRDVTGTVESIPLVTASILSKKLAEGCSALVMDVKCGRGAFTKTLPEARALAESLVRVGTANGLKMGAYITNMDVPLGRTVGNGLEVAEAIQVLQGYGPDDLRDLSVLLAARMVALAGLARDAAEAEAKVRAALSSGAGLAKLGHLIDRQGGRPGRTVEGNWWDLRPRRAVQIVGDGYITGMDAEKVGTAAVVLGAGRQRAEDAVDPRVGILIQKKPGDRIAAKDDCVFIVVHNRDDARFAAARELLESAVTVGPAPPPPAPLVLETIA